MQAKQSIVATVPAKVGAQYQLRHHGKRTYALARVAQNGAWHQLVIGADALTAVADMLVDVSEQHGQGDTCVGPA